MEPLVDETLAERIRTVIGDDPNVGEVKMFGGLCFMLNGNMLVCASSKGGLLVRTGEAGMEAALKKPGVTTMEMGGRTMSAYVWVDPETLTEPSLREWIAGATDFVATLPPKEKKAKAAKTKKKSA